MFSIRDIFQISPNEQIHSNDKGTRTIYYRNVFALGSPDKDTFTWVVCIENKHEDLYWTSSRREGSKNVDLVDKKLNNSVTKILRLSTAHRQNCNPELKEYKRVPRMKNCRKWELSWIIVILSNRKSTVYENFLILLTFGIKPWL